MLFETPVGKLVIYSVESAALFTEVEVPSYTTGKNRTREVKVDVFPQTILRGVKRVIDPNDLAIRVEWKAGRRYRVQGEREYQDLHPLLKSMVTEAFRFSLEQDPKLLIRQQLETAKAARARNDREIMEKKSDITRIELSNKRLNVEIGNLNLALNETSSAEA